VWLAKGLWAVTDQGLFALSNFGVSVLLARWLPPRDYGTFAVAFSALLLMGTVHTALLTEPMLVYGPSRYGGRTASYLRRLLPLHLLLTAGMSLVLLVGLLVLVVARRSVPAAPTLVALSVAAPGILFLWLTRRAAYIDSRPRLAAAAGAWYAVLVLLAMVLLTRVDRLTAASAWLMSALASLLAGAALALRLSRSTTEPPGGIALPEVATAHWQYGRWALGSGVLGWVPSNVVILALPLWHSLEDAGTLRVASTLILPVLHVEGALALLLTPALVRARLSGRLRAEATLATGILVALSLLYAPLVIAFGTELVRLLFGAQYRLDSTQLWLVATIPVAAATSLAAGSVLRALERPDLVLRSYLVTAVVAVAVGLPMVFAWGITGALGSILLSTATTALLTAAAAGSRVTADPARRGSGRHRAGPVPGPDAVNRLRGAEPRPSGMPRHRRAGADRSRHAAAPGAHRGGGAAGGLSGASASVAGAPPRAWAAHDYPGRGSAATDYVTRGWLAGHGDAADWPG
jgi:O-antigen/teichoic acid export membrane protein